MKALTWIAFGAVLVTAGSLASACGDEEGGGKGGSGGGVLEAGAAGSGGTAGGGGITILPDLGAACTSDADCGDGTTCVPPDSIDLLGAGPANGMCTIECTGDPEICTRHGALCLGNSRLKSFCFEGCTFAQPPSGTNVKCHSRSEMACTPFYEATPVTCVDDLDCDPGVFCIEGQCSLEFGFCLPQCNIDSDCPSGTFCDFGSALAGGLGLCRAQQPTGLATGEACDPRADTCRGYCFPFSDTSGMCMDGCTFGPPPGCGWEGPSAGPADAICWDLLAGTAFGDAGLCLELCDCDGDCAHPGNQCYPFQAGSGFQEYYGRAGLCDLADPMLPGIPCGAGGGGGMGGGGGVAGSPGGAGGASGAGG
jgi:hypothetical protein